MSPLPEWQNFYEIVGEAAASLTGLQFVSMALLANMPQNPEDSQAGTAFASPSVVHFGTALLLAALMSMPWSGLSGLTVVWAVAGISGAVYMAVIVRRMRVQQAYRPVAEDWIFRVLSPSLAYLSLAGAAVLSRRDLRPALFAVGGAILLLLFTGIHNAWDNLIYLVFVKKREAS